jgi:hypothetical protein
MDETSKLLQQLCDVRDRTAPGSPEEEQATLALLDAILGGGRPQGSVPTRLSYLRHIDWAVIAMGIIGFAVAVYLQTLRHP